MRFLSDARGLESTRTEAPKNRNQRLIQINPQGITRAYSLLTDAKAT
jgi:hypothetical protein